MSTAIIYTDDATRYFDHYKCKHCEKVEWREGSFGPTWWRLSRYETSSGIYNGLFCSDCFSKKMENKPGSNQGVISVMNLPGREQISLQIIEFVMQPGNDKFKTETLKFLLGNQEEKASV